MNKNQQFGDIEVIDGLTVYPTLEEAEEWGAFEDDAIVEDEENEEEVAND